jgi:hypothetical protein
MHRQDISNTLRSVLSAKPEGLK